MFYKLLVVDARVAQLVEQRTENPRVGGSIPSPSTTKTPDFSGVLLYIKHSSHLPQKNSHSNTKKALEKSKAF